MRVDEKSIFKQNIDKDRVLYVFVRLSASINKLYVNKFPCSRVDSISLGNKTKKNLIIINCYKLYFLSILIFMSITNKVNISKYTISVITLSHEIGKWTSINWNK